MTVNINQNVIPRSRHTSRPVWQHQGVRQRTSALFIPQSGSINSATLTTTLAIVLVLGVAFLSFFYLRQVINTASQGTDIRLLEERLVDLREKQRELELEGAQLRSIENVQERIPDLNLVTTQQVAYIKPLTAGTVALAE